MASDAVLAVQQVLNQQNGHHPPLPPVTSSPPQLLQPAVTQPPQVPPLPPSKRQAPLDSTTTTDPDDSVSLSSLSQPASSHSQKSLLNKSAVVSFLCNCRDPQVMRIQIVHSSVYCAKTSKVPSTMRFPDIHHFPTKFLANLRESKTHKVDSSMVVGIHGLSNGMQ